MKQHLQSIDKIYKKNSPCESINNYIFVWNRIMPNQKMKQVKWQQLNWNKYDFILFRNKRRIFSIFYKSTYSIKCKYYFVENYFCFNIFCKTFFIMYLFSHFSRIINLKFHGERSGALNYKLLDVFIAL